MYNRFKKGTDAFYSTHDAIVVIEELEGATQEAQSLFERLIDELETASDQVEEAESDVKAANEQIEELEAQLDKYKFSEDHVDEFLTVLRNIRMYADDQIAKMETYKRAQQKDADIDAGTGSNDSPESMGNKADPANSTGGVSGP
jgi:chromosome segregation ATPase